MNIVRYEAYGKQDEGSTEGVTLSGAAKKQRDRMWIALWRHPSLSEAEGARGAQSPNLSGKRTELFSALQRLL